MNALLNRPTLAIGLAILGFAVFSWGDAISRHLIKELDYNVFFVVGACQLVGMGVLLSFHHKLGGLRATLASKNKKLHLLRGLLLSVSVPSNAYAFSVLPFAFTYTILFTGAFWLLLLSALITHERIPMRKALGVCLGMTGALIVLRPWADAFDWRMLIPVVSAIMYAIQSLVARRMGGAETGLSLAFYAIGVCGSVMFAIAFSQNGIRIPPIADLPFFLACGVCAGIGMLCVPLAFRYADASIVGPFHYTQLIWAAMIGFVFFHEVPSVFTMIGAAFIVSGGLIALMAARQNKLT